MCTSGTTGMPKGACKSHKMLISNIVHVSSQISNDCGGIFFPSSLYAVTTIYAILLSALFGEKRIISTVNMKPELFMEIVEKYNASMVLLVPLLMSSFKQCKHLKPMKNVTTVLTGATIITSDFMKNAKELFPNARIVCAYGSCEGDIITYIKKESKSWSSGEVTNGYQVKVNLTLFDI
jgi:acyl-CoA synthetase (AMP-forming)/AMP-acid ligase II